jgi:cyanophycinase
MIGIRAAEAIAQAIDVRSMRVKRIGSRWRTMRVARAAIAMLLGIGAPVAGTLAQNTPSAPPPPVRGTLFIVGGGTQPPDLVKEFVTLAGGPGHSRIAILPMASEESAASGREKADELRGLGADAFVVDVTRQEAGADSVVKLINSATGIWFPGGDQVRLASHLRGSAALRAIHDRYRDGAVVGGTSAGAAVMSDSMLTGNQFFPGVTTAVDSGVSSRRIGRAIIEVVPGLGFLHDAIVDQHFITRQRENRLISVILERPSFIGVGIDEGTALRVYPDGHWQVLGASAAIVFDARNASVTPVGSSRLGAAGIRVSVLPAGSTFDPVTGRATLPPASQQ